MATVIEYIAASATAEATAPIILDANQLDSHAESQPISEGSSSINAMNNSQSSNDAITTNSQIESTENINLLPDPGSIEEHQKSENENHSLNNSSEKCVKKKYGRFLDSDSEEEDDMVSLLLDKSNSDKEKSASSESLDQNNKETSNLESENGKNVDSLPHPGSAKEHQQSNVKKHSLQDSLKRVKEKYKRFLDSDSEDEDGIVPSLLDKSNSDKEKNASSESLDQNNKETSNLQSENGKNVDPLPHPGSAKEHQQSNIKKNSLQDSLKRVKEKYKRFLDSDSEDEDDIVPSLLDKSNSEKEKNASSESLDQNNMETSKLQGKKGKIFRSLIDSDSENDDIVDEAKNDNISEENNDLRNTMKKKISMLVDSDSEDNNVSEDPAPSSPVQRRRKVTSNRKKKRAVEKPAKKSKLSALIDTDSEDDNEVKNVDESLVEGQNNIGLSAKKNQKSTKKRTGSQRDAKDEAMRQIHSETQRLIRSSEVSLPYHRPKQRSLQDFLNRKKFIPALPEGLTTAAKVKMSSEIVGKVLEEKEKEAELFYKSSDSEEESTSCTPANVNDTNESSSADILIDQIGIEETQKLLKNDIQNAHNKKEILKQGAVDLGVPRKLFIAETKDFTENGAATDEEKMEEDEDEFECEIPRKKTKETKHGLKEASVPRKLFSSDYDEGVGSPSKNYDVSTLVTSKTTASSEMIEGQSVSVDEGIDSLEQENEFSWKSGEPSGEKNNLDIERNECNTITKESSETSNIADTPFISNKDIAKVNEKHKESRQRVDFGESLIAEEDQSDPQNVFSHVIGLPPPDMDEDIPKVTEKLNVKSKVLSAISKVCPKLRGAPGMLIDFSDEVKPNKEGVKSLLDRFYRHSVVNKPAEVNTSVTVLHTEKTADGIQIVEQVLPYKLPKNDLFNDKELDKPGAKHARLKSALIETMAKKRGEEWKLKEQQEKEEEEYCDSEEIEDESDSEADVKLVEEENEISAESEPEEDDMPEIKKKKRKPSEFVNEEAEVSGEENDEVMQVGSEDDEDEEDDDNEGNTSQGDDNETGDNLSDVDAKETVKKNKRSSRIMKAFEDDSNSLPEISSQNVVDSREKTFQRTKTDVDMFETEDGNADWLSDTEAELPPSQILPRDQADARSQLCKTPLTAINVLRFVSPITQLTALNSAMDSPNDCSATKSQSSSQRIAKLSTEKTPKESPISCVSENRIGFQKKLFQDPAGTVNDEELMDLCSGTFTGIETEDRSSLTISFSGKLSASSQVSQILGLSSGSFFSQAIDSDKVGKITKPDVDETSQDIRLTLDDDSRDPCDNAKGKETANKNTISRAEFKVVSSSDDEDELRNEPRKKKVLKKKRVKQLELSDDEDAAEFSNVDEEEEHELSCNDTEDKYVDYDSEENEVVIVPQKDIKKVAANFLDAEAELSESEWGSADEDEKDMDKLELEEGDDEEIDEKQMRDQLGKMHVRQILDDDQRDVRMLQELLFEDGDLHTDGSGRERKFKWKNIDKLGEDGNIIPGTDDVDENGEQIEEENDLEWRKLRLEREKFIQEKMKIPTDEIHDEMLQDTTFFKLGMKALSKRKSSQSTQKESDEPVAKKPLLPRTIMDLVASPAGDQRSKILHKAVNRGSFLARGDESLARLAVHIKQTDTTTIVTQKNRGNFVFARISPSVANAASKEQKVVTESEADSTVNAMARKRKPPSGVTPRTVKKAKIDTSRSTGKKLF